MQYEKQKHKYNITKVRDICGKKRKIAKALSVMARAGFSWPGA